MLDKAATLAPPPPTVNRVPPAVPQALRRYLCLDDFEATARRRIPKFLYGYISGGAETDAAVRDNRKAFDEYGFVPRVLNDVSGRGQTTQLFGKTYDAPFGLEKSDSFTLHAQETGAASYIRGQAAVPLFDDRREYWDPALPFVGG